MSRLGRREVSLLGALGLITFITFGCADDDHERVTFENRSDFTCFTSVVPLHDAPDAPLDVAADSPFHVTIGFVVGTNAHDADLACEAIVQGDRIELRSQSTWLEGSHDRFLVAVHLLGSCTMPPLPEGEYRIVHGGLEVPLTVPGTFTQRCYPFEP